jgi:hypothetical protein
VTELMSDFFRWPLYVTSPLSTDVTIIILITMVELFTLTLLGLSLSDSTLSIIAMRKWTLWISQSAAFVINKEASRNKNSYHRLLPSSYSHAYFTRNCLSTPTPELIVAYKLPGIEMFTVCGNYLFILPLYSEIKDAGI